MSSSHILFVVAIACVLCTIECQPNTVKVRQGVLQGIEIVSKKGNSYIAFKGIPYAKAPLDKLRFKAPQPPDEWSDTRQANKDGSMCPQIDPETNNVVGHDDCLFLNVYIPKTNDEKSATKFPVLIFLHGGGFQSGSGSSEVYNPSVFTDRDIIVVTLNYRLGVLGFLSTTDDYSPGNYGLLDQLEALRWIQQNIGQFRGDVNQVTLLGHDAGAASALLHLVSPLSKGLFHQIIALSGPPTCDNYIQKNPSQWVTKLGTELDCFVVDRQILLNCLRKTTTEDLVRKANALHEISNYPAIFLPVVERVHNENGDFLIDTPINLLKEGKVNRAPVILGISRTEGELFYQEMSQHYSNKDTQYFEESLPKILKLATSSYKHNLKAISLAIKKEYFSGIDVTNDKANFDNITIEMYADMLIRRCNDVTAKHLSNAGWPTYMYTFETPDQQNPSNLDNDLKYLDELKYVFRANDDETDHKLTEDETQIQKILIHLWVNFIKTSMPTPTKTPIVPFTWIPMNPGKIRYLKLGSKPELIDGYLKKRMNFWNTKVPKIEAQGEIKDEL